jgi:hypothetical protein
MESFVVVEPKNPVMHPQQGQSLQYFLSSLAGIARALEDFGYRDEAVRLARVKEDLETKVMLPKEK